MTFRHQFQIGWLGPVQQVHQRIERHHASGRICFFAGEVFLQRHFIEPLLLGHQFPRGVPTMRQETAVDPQQFIRFFSGESLRSSRRE